jgi:hypothetical protein
MTFLIIALSITAWILLGLFGAYLNFKYLLKRGDSLSLGQIIAAMILGPLAVFAAVLFIFDKKIVYIKK